MANITLSLMVALILGSSLSFAGVIVDEESGAMVSTGDEQSAGTEERVKAWDPKDPGKGFLNADEEGAYYYSESDADGSKQYETDIEWKPKQENFDKGLIEVKSDGSYIYQSNETEQTGAASIRIGSMSPPQIENEEGFTYKDFYGDKSVSVLLYDYEFQGLLGVQYLAFSLGTGISVATGPGRFASDPTVEAKEKYSFYLVPNHLSLSYRFQYVKRQWIAPYISAGFMPIGIVEYRDDNESTTITNSTAVHTTGGLKINLNALDAHSAFIMDSEYGVNSFWLDLEFKLIQGLDKKIDLSSQIINAGLGFDF